jgi:hypothetical protein
MHRPPTTDRPGADPAIADLCLRLAEVAARGTVLAAGPLAPRKQRWLLAELAADLAAAAALAAVLAETVPASQKTKEREVAR